MSTAYVYNPLKTVTLRYSGQNFVFENGKITIVRDHVFTAPDMYRRNHESEPDGNAMLRSEVDGMALAKRMLDRHRINYMDRGFYLGSKKPTKDDIVKCESKADRYKRVQIANAKKERHDRFANAPGRSDMDQEVLDWMNELDIQDEIYLPNPKTNAAGAATVVQAGVSEEVMARIATTAAIAAVRAVKEMDSPQEDGAPASEIEEEKEAVSA